MAAEPSIGRAARVEGMPAPEADLTRALYEQYGSQIFRYCLHQLGSREEAEDAVQSTFLNAFRGIKRGIVPELESAWLFKIAQNVCLSRRRSTWRRDRIESPTNFEVVEELMPAPSRRADELMGLQDVLEQLPENQRRAILLREWQGLSYHEIADELELSQAAVETLIFRARRALAQGLEEPPVPKKRRLARSADWGNVLAGLKSLLLGGGAAVKVAATVAVVSATTVVAAEPVVQHHARPHATPAAAVSVSAKTTSGTSAATSFTANLAGGVPAPAHHPAAPGASLSAATPAETPAPAATVSPDTALPAVEAPAAPPPAEAPAPAPAPAAAAPSQPAAGSGGSQGDASGVVVKPPVEVKKDGPSVTTTVVTPPATEPTGSGSGSGASSNSPAPEQTPVLAPVTTTLSASPAGDSPPSTSPASSTPTTVSTSSPPTGTQPAVSLTPSLSVQPPTTTSGHGSGTSGSHS